MGSKKRIQFIDFCKGCQNAFTNFLKEFNYEFEIVTNNAQIIFISVFGATPSVRLKKLSEKHKTVFYTGESGRLGGKSRIIPRINPYTHLNLTFENTSQYNNIRYPLWLLYAQIHKSEMRKELTNMKLTTKPIHGFCSFVYSNPIKHRDDFFKQLSTYKKVYSGGRCFNNVTENAFTHAEVEKMTTPKIKKALKQHGLSNQGLNDDLKTRLLKVRVNVKDKLEFQTKYKFCIAYENCSQEGYTTEKIFDAYRSNSIPIYYGSITITDDFNPQTFINAHDFNSIDSLINYIKKVDNDDDLYNSFMNKPIFSEKWLNIFKDPPATFFKNIAQKIMT